MQLFNISGKYPNHSSLECGWCITQPKREYPVFQGTLGTGEGGLVLVLESNLDLIVTAKSIHKGKKLLPRQGIKYLINKR